MRKLMVVGMLLAATMIPTTGRCAPRTSQGEIHKLVVAASDGDLPKVKAVFRRGRTPKLIDGISEYGESTWTALGSAVWWNHPGTVRYLISRGANIDGRDRHGRTPLFLAAEKGRVEFARLLISKGADVKAKDADMQTPLHPAAHGGRNDIIRLLLASGADAVVNARDTQNRNALLVAMISWGLADSSDFETIRLLVDAHSDVNFAETGDLWTSLHLAAASYDDRPVSLLLDHGANMKALTDQGMTPLQIAAFWRCKNAARLLIERGAEPDIFSAVYLGDRAMVEELLNKRPALLEAREYRGETPLHEAADRGEKSIVEVLLARGAKVNVKTYYGSTPLTAAIEHKHPEVAELLRSHGAR